MENQKSFTRIKGLSSVRRLPRLGKIRLGIKRVSPKSGASYPAEVDYFVCPAEVQKIYGEQPKELDVMFPIENEQVTFPQALKRYTSSSLRCKGDGETAMCKVSDLTDEQKAKLNGDISDDISSLVEVDCPCPHLESGKCSQVGNLLLLLPRVSMAGVYQIDTGSSNNIVRINSSIDYVRGLVGRVSLVPLKLKRIQEEMSYFDEKEQKDKKSKHYLLSLEFPGNIDDVKKLKENTSLILTQVSSLALPAPVEDGDEPTSKCPEVVDAELETATPADSPAHESKPNNLINIMVKNVKNVPKKDHVIYEIFSNNDKMFWTKNTDFANLALKARKEKQWAELKTTEECEITEMKLIGDLAF